MMLEVFDTLGHMGKEKEIVFLKKECDDASMMALVQHICYDKNVFITPVKIYNMMKYYGVESSKSVDEVGEIGEFAMTRMKLLKRKEFGWKSLEGSFIVMNNVSFLLDAIRDLKVSVSPRVQYEILYKCFSLLSPCDIKWFARILCNKVIIPEGDLEVIDYGTV